MYKLIYILLLICLTIYHADAQVLIAEESFEGTVGEHGYTTIPEAQCACCTTNPYVTWERSSDSDCASMDIYGIDGSYYWIAEKLVDVNLPLPPPYTRPAIILNTIQIAGVSNLEIRLKAGQGAFNHFESGDYLHIQYAIDGNIATSTYTKAAQFIPVESEETNLAFDSDANNNIDGATLSDTLAEFTVDLGSLTGDSISIRLLFSANSFSEEIVVDHIQLFGELPLPAELSRFSATPKPDGVQLEWTSASELQMAGYEIQKKTARTDWDRKAWQAAEGTELTIANYQWKDKTPQVGWQYYRLKLIDEDGSFTYSPQRAVFFESLYTFEIGEFYPNPVSPGSSLFLPIISKKALAVSLRVFAAQSGQLIHAEHQQAISGDNVLSLTVADWPEGVYVVEVIIDGISEFRKLVIL